MPLAHSGEYSKVKNISVRHLGRLGLPVPPYALGQLLRHDTSEFGVFVGAGLIALNHHRMALQQPHPPKGIHTSKKYQSKRTGIGRGPMRGAPEYMEVSQLNAILDPVESHVDGTRSFLLSNVIGNVVGGEIVRDHHGRWLRVSHLFQNGANVFAV